MEEYPVDKSVGGINAAPTNKGSVQFLEGVAAYLPDAPIITVDEIRPLVRSYAIYCEGAPSQ